MLILKDTRSLHPPLKFILTVYIHKVKIYFLRFSSITFLIKLSLIPILLAISLPWSIITYPYIYLFQPPYYNRIWYSSIQAQNLHLYITTFLIGIRRFYRKYENDMNLKKVVIFSITSLTQHQI
jgi:hypothetical protein